MGIVWRFLTIYSELLEALMDCSRLRRCIRDNFSSNPLFMKYGLHSYFEFSKRPIDLEQTLNDEFTVGCFKYIMQRLDLLVSREISEICDFLVGHGFNIECKDQRGETALLNAARSDLMSSLKWILALLQCGAIFLAIDFKGRGPLHLSLGCSRGPARDPWCSATWVDL